MLGPAPLLSGSVRPVATATGYDNATSGLTAATVQAALDELVARVVQAEQATEPQGWLDTTATAGDVTATADIRAGRAQMSGASADLVINHPRLTENAVGAAWIEGSIARLFYGYAYTAGSMTFRTTSTTTLPIRWIILRFGDEDT